MSKNNNILTINNKDTLCNSMKTTIENSVAGFIKLNKLAYIYSTLILKSKKEFNFDSFDKHLLYDLILARRYSDKGSIKRMSLNFGKHIDRLAEISRENFITLIFRPKMVTNHKIGSCVE